MKRHELKCPGCKAQLTDLQSAMKCESCHKHFQVTITKKGVQQLLFIALPCLTVAVAMFVMNWKLAGFLDVPNREVIIYSTMGAGFLGFMAAVMMMKNQFAVGKELESNAKK